MVLWRCLVLGLVAALRGMTATPVTATPVTATEKARVAREFAPLARRVAAAGGANVACWTEPQLDLGLQTEHIGPLVPSLVPLGPALVAGEGPLADNTTLVRVYNRYQAKTAQFLAYPPSVRGGVQVCALDTGQETLLVTAPCADRDVRVLHLFDLSGGARGAFATGLRPPFTLTTGRFVAAERAERLAVTEQSATNQVVVHTGQVAAGRADVAWQRLVLRLPPQPYDQPYTIRLVTLPAEPDDLLAIQVAPLGVVYVANLVTNALALLRPPGLAPDQSLVSWPCDASGLAASGSEPVFSRLTLFGPDLRPRTLDVGQRENRYWYVGKQLPLDQMPNGRYARRAAHCHFRTDTTRPDMTEDNDDTEAWAVNYHGHPFVEERWRGKEILPTQFQAAILNGGWLPADSFTQRDTETGRPLYRIADARNESRGVEVTYAPNHPLVDKFYFWGMRGWLRNLAVDVRTHNPDTDLVGVSPMHEIGSGGDWSPANIRAFRDQLLYLYGSLEAVNARFGTSFRSPALTDFDAPRKAGRGAWDQGTNDFWRAWMSFCRCGVHFTQLKGFRECALAGFPPEAINSHMIPDNYSGANDFTGNTTPSAGCPVDLILTAGTAYGGTRYGPVHGRRFEWLPAAFSSGHTMVTAGEYGSGIPDPERNYRFFYDWMFNQGLCYLHTTHPNWDNGMEYLARWMRETEAVGKPRPGTTGGVGQVRAAFAPVPDYTIEETRPGRRNWVARATDRRESYAIAALGAGPERGALLKSLRADGTWNGLVYLKPFHAKVQVQSLLETAQLGVYTSLPDRPTARLTHAALAQVNDFYHGDQLELRCEARLARGERGRLFCGVYHDLAARGLGRRQSNLVWLRREELGASPEAIAKAVRERFGGYALADAAADFALAGNTWRPLRFVLANQLMLDGVQLVLADLSAQPGDVELRNVSLTVQRELAARPAHSLLEGTPQRGGVTFDVVSRDLIPRRALGLLTPATTGAAAREQLRWEAAAARAAVADLRTALPARPGEPYAARVHSPEAAAAHHQALASAETLAQAADTSAEAARAARDRLVATRQALDAAWRVPQFPDLVGGRPAVVTRGAPRWVEGRFGRALFCDETGDQLTVEGLSFGAQSGASLGLWLKMPRRIISGGMLRFERALTLKGYWNSHGELELSFDQGPKTEAIRPRGQRLDDDAWHHVALVKDGTQASLFVDGRPVLTLPGLPATLNTTRLILGGQAQAYDELALFNRALTAAQVQALTTRAVTAVEPGLAHAWSFDEAEAVAREAAPR